MVSGNLDDAVADFSRSRNTIYEAILMDLVAARRNVESADFAKVLKRAQSGLNLTDLELSRMFKVSRPTVNRWIRGVTAPHPLLRASIFDALLERAKSQLKKSRHRAD